MIKTLKGAKDFVQWARKTGVTGDIGIGAVAAGASMLGFGASLTAALLIGGGIGFLSLALGLMPDA